MAIKDNYTANYGDDFKEPNKHIYSKFEYDLYHDEDNVIMPVVRVKHINLPNKCEKWKIIENDKTVFVIEGIKLLKKERRFLQTLDGVNFLIAQYKKGIKSFHSLRKEMKIKINS